MHIILLSLDLCNVHMVGGFLLESCQEQVLGFYLFFLIVQLSFCYGYKE